MELQSRNLVVDTQYFVSIKFDFNHHALLKLKKLIDKKSIKLFLTEITVREVNKKIDDKISSAFSKITSGDFPFLKAISSFSSFVESYDVPRAIEEVKENFEIFLKEFQVEIIPCDTVKISDIFSMYFEIKAPFSEKKMKEFPDAFVLASISEWCKNENESVYLLSKDIDWKNYVSNNYIYTSKNNGPLLIYQEELSPFIDSVIRKDKELKDQVSFADKELEKNWEIIKKGISNEFYDLEFESYGYNEEEVADVYLIDCRILEKDILEAKQDAASYELLIEFDLIVKFDISDFTNAFYDGEDSTYYNVKSHHIYNRFSIEESVVVDFSFEGGLDRNFNVENIEHSIGTIVLDFEEGDYIEIEEWSRNLPVIINGVKDNIITEDGSGIMEFINFKEAQEIFPQLEIKHDNPFFTRALGNKINEDLRFETWEAVGYKSL